MRLKLKQTLTPKILFNIGACFDIPTGAIVTGARGEKIINGGLAIATAVVGIGNQYKSTILHYMGLQAVNRLRSIGDEYHMNTYDTEVNITTDRLDRLVSDMDWISSESLFSEEGGVWSITDKTMYYADEWIEEVKKYLKEKSKSNKDMNLVYAPFTDAAGNTITLKKPDFIEIDSFSEFEGAKTVKTLDDHKLDDAKTNTVFMQQGLLKTKFLGELPRLSVGGNTYFLLTAQVGKKIEMASGPFAPPPEKKLQYLKNGDSLKGVSSKFFFLMSNCWHAYGATQLMHRESKLPEYPKSKALAKDPAELNVVKLRQLRSKSGPTGYTIDILLSQKDGVLPSLTEFHYIKNNGRYGLGGNDRNYYLELKPDVKLSRTTVRGKIDNDKLLQRAMNITSEMCQMETFWPHYREEGLLCDPVELYSDLKGKGYDWNVLLNTRGWWSPNQYDHPMPFLSTIDLLRMRKGLYHPYWLKKLTKEKK